MWISSVPVAASVLPSAAPAAAPAGVAAPFDEALDASLLDAQAPRAGGAPARQVPDQRALVAWLLGGKPVGAAASPPEAEATASGAEVEIDEDLDQAVEHDGDSDSEIAMDVLLLAPVPHQQAVAESTVTIPVAAAERPAAGDGGLTPAVTVQDGANVQDATFAQNVTPAAETARAQTTQAAPEEEATPAPPQDILRLKPEATVRKPDAAVNPDAARSDAETIREGTQRAESSIPAERTAGASAFAVRHPVANRHTETPNTPTLPVAVVERSQAMETAPVANAAVGAQAQVNERDARDTTIAMSRVLVSGPAVAQVQAQMGGGDAQTFEQDGRQSPAAQRLAAALSMASPGSARDANTGSAPVFSLPVQPVAPAPVAAPIVTAAPATATTDAENVQTLVQTMRFTAKAGGWEATVRLKPEHMGEVTIALRVDGKNVSAVVQAESAAVRQWLTSQEEAIRSGLSEQGLQLDRFTVSRDGQRREAEEQHAQQPPRRRAQRQAAMGTEPRFEVIA